MSASQGARTASKLALLTVVVHKRCLNLERMEREAGKRENRQGLIAVDAGQELELMVVCWEDRARRVAAVRRQMS